jgi:hypothetical protein
MNGSVLLFPYTISCLGQGQRYLLDAFTKLRNATISFVISFCPSVSLSVRPSAWNNSAPTGQISMKIDIGKFFEKLLRKFKFH